MASSSLVVKKSLIRDLRTVAQANRHASIRHVSDTPSRGRRRKRTGEGVAEEIKNRWGRVMGWNAIDKKMNARVRTAKKCKSSAESITPLDTDPTRTCDIQYRKFVHRYRRAEPARLTVQSNHCGTLSAMLLPQGPISSVVGEIRVDKGKELDERLDFRGA